MPARADGETLILTLELDDASFAWLDALRVRHFPRERNFLPAHLTLFHTLSPPQGEGLQRVADAYRAIDLSFTGIRRLGGGVAIDVDAPDLHRLHDDLFRRLGGEFTRQDRQPFRPHVTIQNKVTAETARRLADNLASTFTPRTGISRALLLWRYDGGPSTLRQRIALAANPT